MVVPSSTAPSLPGCGSGGKLEFLSFIRPPVARTRPVASVHWRTLRTVEHQWLIGVSFSQGIVAEIVNTTADGWHPVCISVALGKPVPSAESDKLEDNPITHQKKHQFTYEKTAP